MEVCVQLIEMKCSGCGAGLEIVPGADHLICEYCGTSYFVQRERQSAPNTAAAKPSLDNPIGVRLVSQDTRYSVLNIVYPDDCILDVPRVYYGYSDHGYSSVHAMMTDRLHLFAGMSYLSKERFDLLVAHFYTDQHLLYHKKYNGENEKPAIPTAKDVSAYSPAELEGFVEPEKLWPGHAFDITQSDPKRSMEQPKKENETRAKRFDAEIDRLIRAYDMKDTRTIRYQAKGLTYKKISLFGKETKHVRLWLQQYTDVCLTMAMTPAKASDILSGQDRETLDRIHKNRSVGEMAGELAQGLDAIAATQLATRENHTVSFEMDKFSMYLQTSYKDRGGDLKGSRKEIPFKKYGMKPLPDRDTLRCAAAAVLSNAFDILKRGGKLAWGIQQIRPSDNSSGLGYTCVLRCETKAEGVYQDW